ncbi:unnamed protein product [Phytomonas sp. EM1]|nr:unnamed protein product [Phytomonas sp. EM1]|eukprot:CCW59640.1 unnamed protein product [Phytomonas sp. isolate EM1]
MHAERDATHGIQPQGFLTNLNVSTPPHGNARHSQNKSKKRTKKPARRTIPRAPYRQLFLTGTSQLLPFHVSKRGREFVQRSLCPRHVNNTTHVSRAAQDASVFLSASTRFSPDSQCTRDPSSVPHSNINKNHEVHASGTSDVFFLRDARQGEQGHDQRDRHDIPQTQRHGKGPSTTKLLCDQNLHTDRFFYISEPVELQIESISGPCVRFMLFLWYFTFLLCVAIDMVPELRWEMLNICNSESVSLRNLNKWNSLCFEVQPSSSKPGYFNVTWTPNLQEDRITPFYELRHIVVSVPRLPTQSGEVVHYNEYIGVISGDAQDSVVMGPVEMTLRCNKKNSLCDVLKLPGGVKFPLQRLFFPELSPELMSAMTGGVNGTGLSTAIGIVFERQTYTVVTAICRYSFIAISFLHMLRFTAYRKHTSHLYEQSWIIGLQIFLIFYLNPLYIESLSPHPSSDILKFFDICLPTCFVAMNLGFMYSVMTASMLWRQRTDTRKAVKEKDISEDSEEESLTFDGTIRRRSWRTNLFKFFFCSKNLYDPPFWTKAAAILYVLLVLVYEIARSLGSNGYDFAGIHFSVKPKDVEWNILALILGCLTCLGLLIYLNNHLGKKPYLESRPQQLACCVFLMIFLFIILFYIINFITLYAYISRYYPVTNPHYPFTHLTSLALNTLFVNIMTFVYTTQHRDENIPIHPNDQRWMLMVWPNTWHTWLARHGGSQYIFFTERQETNFYTRQLDFHKRQLMARLKKRKDYTREDGQRSDTLARTTSDLALRSAEQSQLRRRNQREGFIGPNNRYDVTSPDPQLANSHPYGEEVKQNGDTLAILSSSKMDTSRKPQPHRLQKDHHPNLETVEVPICIQNNNSPHEYTLPKVTSGALKSEQGNQPYGFSVSPKLSCKYHSRVGSKVGFLEEDLNPRNATRGGNVAKGLAHMDRFSSSYLPELPEDDFLLLTRSRRAMAQSDKAPFLSEAADSVRVFEPQVSSLPVPGLGCTLNGSAKRLSRLERSTQRAFPRGNVGLTSNQPPCTRLVLVSSEGRGAGTPSSMEGYSPQPSATNRNVSSIQSVALAMRTLVRSRSPSQVSDIASAPTGYLSSEWRGLHKRERSHDCDATSILTNGARKSWRSCSAHTPKEMYLAQSFDGNATHTGSECNRFTLRKAMHKVHIGINTLVGVAERNLFTRPMYHIDQLQKIMVNAFYKPFEGINYLPFFNLETAIDCFNLSWEVYRIEESHIAECVEMNNRSDLSSAFQRILCLLKSLFRPFSASIKVSNKKDKLPGSVSANKGPDGTDHAINRAGSAQEESEFVGEQTVEACEACHEHVVTENPAMSNVAHPKDEKKLLPAFLTRAKSASETKIVIEKDAHTECPGESYPASTNLETDDVKERIQSETTVEQVGALSDFNHSIHHEQETIAPETSTSPVVSERAHLNARVLPMNVEKYGYKPIMVTQIKEVQVLIAQIDTNARQHLYKAPRVVIALRGTANWSNARDDMNVNHMVWDEMVEDIEAMNASGNQDSFMTKLNSGALAGCTFLGRMWKPTCHGGFLTIWKAMRPVIIPKILEVLRTDPDTVYRVFTTGHSLGGALASLCAYSVTRELQRIRYPIPEVTVYSYGTPRTGNALFCRLYNRAVPRTFHVTNESDLVATMGIFCDHHVGIEVKIDRNGNYIVKPTNIEKIFPPTRGTGLSVMNHLMTAYGASLNAIARHSECMARCWEPYLTQKVETACEECAKCRE